MLPGTCTSWENHIRDFENLYFVLNIYRKSFDFNIYFKITSIFLERIRENYLIGFASVQLGPSRTGKCVRFVIKRVRCVDGTSQIFELV